MRASARPVYLRTGCIVYIFFLEIPSSHFRVLCVPLASSAQCLSLSPSHHGKIHLDDSRAQREKKFHWVRLAAQSIKNNFAFDQDAMEGVRFHF